MEPGKTGSTASCFRETTIITVLDAESEELGSLPIVMGLLELVIAFAVSAAKLASAEMVLLTPRGPNNQDNPEQGAA